MAKKKAPAAAKTAPKEGLSIKVNFNDLTDNYGRKLKVKVSLLQDGNVISEDEDFVNLPLKK